MTKNSEAYNLLNENQLDIPAQTRSNLYQIASLWFNWMRAQ